MKASFMRRFSAYVIDIMIVGALILLFNHFIIPENNNISVLNQELNDLNERIIQKEITFSSYVIHLSEIIHNLDEERIMTYIINAILIITYFAIIPYFKDGKTLGNYIVGIRIIREDREYLSLNNLLIRNMIINGLGYLLTSLVFVYLLPSFSYFIVVSIFGVIQIILVIVSVFMVIYRRDKRGLQDILSKTRVIID
ncbi:MAG: RDD family protein [Mollicutes bacterium]|nr:RDD family protein [Mollicutes bacterium]